MVMAGMLFRLAIIALGVLTIVGLAHRALALNPDGSRRSARLGGRASVLTHL
jgi:hypothetical protein